MHRRVFHSMVFYGFLGAFVSTVAAAFMQEVLGYLPPYPLLSIPVVAGSAGGAAMLVGAVGLLLLKRTANVNNVVPSTQTRDTALLVSLVAVNATGFAVLLLRETMLMGFVLAVHLGVVAALFLAFPYGKFAHAMYRSLALLRDRSEARREELGTQDR